MESDTKIEDDELLWAFMESLNAIIGLVGSRNEGFELCDPDIAISGAFGTSSMGSWLENTGDINNPWIPHLQPIETDMAIRGTLAYKSADLNGDGYPEVVYNAIFDIPGTDPPRYRSEIWLAINPGPSSSWNEPWLKVVINDDNWASADMWFHDFDGDV